MSLRYLIAAASLAAAIPAAAQQKAAPPIDISATSGERIQPNNSSKSGRFIYLYSFGTLDYVRYRVDQNRLDTFHFDHRKLEAAAYQTMFGKKGIQQMELVRQLTKNEAIHVQDLSANEDTVTTVVGIRTYDSVKSNSFRVALRNGFFIVRVVGNRLVSIENITPFSDRYAEEEDDEYSPSFQFLLFRPGFLVAPVLSVSHLSSPQSKPMIRISNPGPRRFIGKENLGLPKVNISNKLAFDNLNPQYDGDYFMYASADQLYRFSTKTVIDLSASLDANDITESKNAGEAQVEVRDLSDLGGGMVALLVRHGNNLRVMKYKVDGAQAVLISEKIVATDYPNAAVGWLSFLVDGKFIAYNSEEKRFKVLAETL